MPEARLRSFDRVEEFLDLCSGFLLDREAENNLMLGIAGLLKEKPDVFTERPYLAAVEADGIVQAAVTRTPPWPLVLSRADDPALGLIVSDLLTRKEALQGMVGIRDSVDRFVRMWEVASGVRYKLEMDQMIYELTEVNETEQAPGAQRRARLDELDMLVDWGGRFIEDAGLGKNEDMKASVLRMIEDGRLHVWEHGEIVSMASGSRPTKTGISVGFVYTPPDLRRRGYATSCVAALSRLLLESGKERCFLYADLANPTSNSIYIKIGYKPVCESAEYRRVEQG